MKVPLKKLPTILPKRKLKADKSMKLNPLIFLIVISIATWGKADNWPQWRGPTGDSVVAPGAYPTEFSKDENVRWKIKLPGLGSSTPIIWDKNIFVSGGDNGNDSVQSYDWNGKLNWKMTFGPERPGKHKNGSGANSSPITDGENLYVYFKSGTVCVTHARRQT